MLPHKTRFSRPLSVEQNQKPNDTDGALETHRIHLPKCDLRGRRLHAGRIVGEINRWRDAAFVQIVLPNGYARDDAEQSA
jgi:hypothetical protein